MKNIKKLATLAAIAIALVAAFMVFHNSPDASLDKNGKTKNEIRKVINSRRSKRPASDRKKGGSKSEAEKNEAKKKRMNSEFYTKLTPAERQLAEAVQSALDDEDFEGVQAAAEAALKSTNPEVRRDAVDALAWFGEDALPELTVLMSDPDEEVAEAAVDGWEHGLAEIEEANDRMRISYLALTALSDPKALDSISSHFSNAATEYIDDPEDEKTQNEHRIEVVQGLVDMIGSDNPNTVAAGKEIYEDVTGNKWISVAEAEKYVSDPDNYEEPDEF